MRLVGVTAIHTASRAMGSKLAEDGGLFLATPCVSVARLMGFRVVEGTNPIVKIVSYSGPRRLFDRPVQIAADDQRKEIQYTSITVLRLKQTKPCWQSQGHGHRYG